MPIVDVTWVHPADEAPAEGLAQALADAVGTALGLSPGHAWVRLHGLPSSRYAENGATLADDELPVFVTLLHAHPPEGAALDEQVTQLTRAIAAASGRAASRVHLEFAPAGAGRIAFGGRRVG